MIVHLYVAALRELDNVALGIFSASQCLGQSTILMLAWAAVVWQGDASVPGGMAARAYLKPVERPHSLPKLRQLGLQLMTGIRYIQVTAPAQVTPQLKETC